MRKIIFFFSLIVFCLWALVAKGQTPIPVHAGSISDNVGGALLQSPWSVVVSGNYAYVVSANSNALQIVDISNPVAPARRGSISNEEGGAKLSQPTSVFVSGNYAYVASVLSNALEIIDISNPFDPVHASSISNGEGGALLNGASSVYVSGNYAYIASKESDALEIVDITDPLVPVHAGSISHGEGGTLLDGPYSVFVLDNYAYVTSVLSDALEVVDISNPLAPVHAGSISDGQGGAKLSQPTSVFVSGNYAYVASKESDALEIVDIGNPAAPVHTSSISNGQGGAKLSQPTSVFVSGNYAYVASKESDALEIVDISTPIVPVHVGSISDGEGDAKIRAPQSIYVLGSYAYIASTNSSALEIVNISNPVAPIHVGSISNEERASKLFQPKSVYVSGNYAYVASRWDHSLEIVDISNPTAPVHTSSISDGEGGALLNLPLSVYVLDNYAYVISGNGIMLEIVDISNPAVPVHAGSISHGEGGALLGGALSVYVSGNYAYVASTTSDALEIVDISNPFAPVHAGSISNGEGGALLDGPVSVYVSGNYAYVASIYSDALEIVDISNPVAPVHAGSISHGEGGALLDGTYSVFVLDNHAYVTSVLSDALEVVDISNPLAPIHAGSISNGEGGALLDYPLSVYVLGNYAYVASQDNNALEIVDISDPLAPVHAASISNGDGGALLDYPQSVYVSGNYAYVASHYSQALEIIAIFTPITPVATSATVITGTSFIANCDYVPNATLGYILDVSTDNFVTFVSGYENLAGAQSISVTGLSLVTTYQYRFRAANPNGTSVNSNVITVGTRPDAPIATPATNIDKYSFTANWEAMEGVDSYYIEVSSYANFSTYVPGYAGTVAIDAAITNENITGLSAGIEYYYRVSSEIASTRSVPSNVISEFTSFGTIVIQSTTNVTETSFIINWQTLTGVTNYFITISTNADLSTPITGYDGSMALSASITSESVAGLSSGTLYHYQLIASTAGGSDAISSIETQLTYPSPPTASAATGVSSNSFIANWSTVTGADNYYLQVSVNNSFSSFIAGYDGTVSMSSTTTTETVSGLGAGTTYFYRVITENTTGQSDPSNSITVGTLLNSPVATSATSIGDISFVANWEVVTGASEYELEISTDEFSSFIEGYSPKIIATTQELVEGLTPESIYSYRVRAKNSSGVSENSNTITATTLQAGTSNTVLNLVDVIYINTQDNTTTQTLNISVSGGTAPYTVVFSHKGILADSFTEITLTEITAGNYSIEILPTMLDELGVEFEITIIDALSNTDSQSGKIYSSFNQSQSPTLSFERFGGNDNSWNLFSVPFDLDNKSVSTMFAEYDANRHGIDWKIVRYSNSANSYLPFNTDQVKLGEAYWFNAKESKPLNLGSGQVTAQIPFSLALLQGWNLIGNPYPVAISWNQVLINNPSVTDVGELQIFTGRNQSTGDVINPFSGGFVFASASTTMIIDPTLSQQGGRLTATSGKIENEDIDWEEWQLDILLISDGDVEVEGGIGMHPEAGLLKDYYDAMSVPRFFDFTDMFTKHEDYFYPWFRKDVVPTDDNYSWTFTVETNKTLMAPELKWNQSALINSESNLYLLDMQSGKLIDMKAQGSHPISLTKGVYKFEVYYSNENSPLLPNDLMLGTAYPNPTESITTIPVILPDGLSDTKMTLSIYDINGKLISTLADGVYSPGFYEFTWNISGDDNRPESGLFIYRLSFNDGSFPPIQKKLIVR